VKIDEKNRLSSDLNSKNSFSLIFIQDLGGDCSDTGKDERQKILDSAEQHHRSL
jgi:hypothetical protein